MNTDEEVYTKAQYESDMAHCAELKHEALHLVSEKKMDGFLYLEAERALNRAEEEFKKRWAQSQALLGALRINKIKLARSHNAEEIDLLTVKIRYLKMLAGKILEGSMPVPLREPLAAPKEWPWIKMFNGWQKVTLE